MTREDEEDFIMKLQSAAEMASQVEQEEEDRFFCLSREQWRLESLT